MTPVDANRHRQPLAAALLIALLLPGLALAETDKERELEARVAQLEQLVQQLVAQQQQAQVQVEAVRAAQAAQPQPAAAKPGIQATPIVPGAAAGTRFSYGGFIKLDAMLTDTTDGEIADGSVGRMFYVPSAIPVGGANEGTDADFGAQFSRFWFAADTDLESGDKVKAYLEFDLYGGGSNAFLGNEVATNTHGLTVRHAYVGFGKWLAGQTWSNFQDVAALPDAVDFVGPTEGTIFVRQAQLRYTTGPWSFSVENPETTVTPYLGAGARISSDDNNVPDLTARWLTKGDWGHFTVAALLRQYRYQNPATGIDDSGSGAALSVSGKVNLGPRDDIRYMASGGRGIGRYLGLGIASDTVLDAAGDLEAIDGYGAFAAWRHVFSPKLRGNLFYSMAHFDNDRALTGLSVTERSQSWHANLIYSPFPKLDVGAELIWGRRSLEGEADGDLRRLHTHVKYSF
ncbi:DcaP family trimeric outer membrane transporter [Cognatiluteimonas weifangensis]|uniref:Porin n=1 Tax=Cognatiluteimonas weifangensis TaxID=2303539 RepID=A0A372DHI0_9GAMM|nr:DcaP family trimeric outer membrane transporter [Luteimonas weifangensis]RFP59020.1 hypothetical protein D0Y53_12005 [Luteimonas weifangensis]